MWDSATKKQFRLALIDVYRDYSLLEIFVADELGERLKEITHEQSLKVVAFKLLEWAESQKRLDELFAAFCRENPRHVLALQPPSSSLSPPPEPPPTPPSVSQEYRRDVVRTELMDSVAPVNRGDSTVISSPKQQPKEKSRSRDTVQEKQKTKPRLQSQSLWTWKWTIAFTTSHLVMGTLLALSNAPLIIWAVTFAGAFAWALFFALCVALVLAWGLAGILVGAIVGAVLGAVVWAVAWTVSGVGNEAWKTAWGDATFIAIVIAMSVILLWATVSLSPAIDAWAMDSRVFWGGILVAVAAVSAAWAVAWDELKAMRISSFEIICILSALAALGLGVGAILAAPLDFTIPVIWID
jgi:hypothetical protein